MYGPTTQNKQDLSPGLSIIHSNRLENLREVAVEWIKRHPLQPLENEIFIVQSNGMAQWLRLALAADDGCGISAAIDFQLPARFLWNIYRAILGRGEVPAESPFDKPRMIWRLLRLIPSLLSDERFKPLEEYLIDDNDLRKRYQLASHLADLYDQYQVYRADWIADWAAGVDQLRDSQGRGVPMAPEQVWQAALWRKIIADVPFASRQKSRSMLHRRFVQIIQTLDKRPPALSRRVIVFGISSLPQQALEALNAIAKHVQVLMCVHNPCRFFWADIIEDRELLKIIRARHERKGQLSSEINPDALHQHVNPLLAAWGKQGRDFIGLLYGYDQPQAYRSNFNDIDLFTDVAPSGGQASLLQQVQQAILDLDPLPVEARDRQQVAPNDASITFQLAHSRQREVEILHDQLLSFFHAQPELEPRDIIVMTPDIDLYAPHIEAVFGNIETADSRYIPFTIADHLQSTNTALVTALEKMLSIPTSRLTAGEVMDLIEVPAFREKFGLAETDIPLLKLWIEGAGIRWGLNARQRSHFDLAVPFEQNTWVFGLKRMLLGYAVGSGASWEEIEPYDEVGGLDSALVGLLYRMLDKIETYCRLFSQPATVQTWHHQLSALLQECFQPVDNQDRLSLGQIEDALDKWLTECNDAGLDEALPLSVVREALLSVLGETRISQRFLAGKVNFGTLMPMRAIPFKIVCLVGMNDGEYPRSRPPVDFDLMSGSGRYRPGDRSRREDDRYLFLEALLSARETFYISYIGRSVRDNSERMPSVLVSQFRDYLSQGWQGEGSGSPNPKTGLLDQLTCLHPLQPFSKTYFHSRGESRLFTYAHEWRQAVLSPSLTEKSVLEPISPQFEGTLQLDSLIRFLKNPVQSFFNQRLKIFFDPITVTTDNREPFVLDALAPFRLGMKLLQAGLAVPLEESIETVKQLALRLKQTGEVPVDALGQRAIESLLEPVCAMLHRQQTLSDRWPHPLPSRELKLSLYRSERAGETLEDWLDQLRGCVAGEVSAAREYARWEYFPSHILDNKRRIEKFHPLIPSWVKHLAGCSQGICLQSHLVTPDGITQFDPLPQDTAQQWLNQIIEQWWTGLALPLPVTAKTAMAYLKAGLAAQTKLDRDAVEQAAQKAARKAYQGDGHNFFGEVGRSPYLQRIYPDFDSLWNAGPHRFRDLAEVLYTPLIESVTVCEDVVA